MLKWTDIHDIAIELTDNHPDVDPQYVILLICANGFWHWKSFPMIQTAAERKFSKQFKWPG